jgi:hypothetical protein
MGLLIHSFNHRFLGFNSFRTTFFKRLITVKFQQNLTYSLHQRRIYRRLKQIIHKNLSIHLHLQLHPCLNRQWKTVHKFILGSFAIIIIIFYHVIEGLNKIFFISCSIIIRIRYFFRPLNIM